MLSYFNYLTDLVFLSQTARHEASLNQLFQTDRQSLLDEISEHRTLANDMKNETVQILSRLERHKAEAKQQGIKTRIVRYHTT